jgi:hypothetical protein
MSVCGTRRKTRLLCLECDALSLMIHMTEDGACHLACGHHRAITLPKRAGSMSFEDVGTVLGKKWFPAEWSVESGAWH